MQTTGQLGRDLPDTEEELFILEQFPLLNIQHGLNTMGSNELLIKMLCLMINTAIPQDLALIQSAYANKDWAMVENLAHKIKSGALYCGTSRMQYACQYLERYRKAGHCKSLDSLYVQLIKVIDDTKKAIEIWLKESSAL